MKTHSVIGWAFFGASLILNHAWASSTLGDLLRDGAGNPIFMDQDHAKWSCGDGRLPTIFELATILNPEGIRPGGYEGSYVSPTDGDRFLYTHNTYSRPQGDLGDVRIWSSSGTRAAEDGGQAFDGKTGGILGHNKNSKYAVRCLVR